jgi:trans-aconitate 2-methyltransferase
VLDDLALEGSEHVLDAGCGSGRLTALLGARVPSGRVVALDRSGNMARVARDTLAPLRSRCAVVAADLLALPFAETFDVVFSTATFHWVLQHESLFAGLNAVMRTGARLHAQCGGSGNLEHAHERAEAVMTSRPFASFYRDWRSPWEFADADATTKRLERAGFGQIRAWLEDAPVELPDAETFRAFMTVVVLRPHLAQLPTDELREQFAADVTKLAAKEDPPFTLDYRRLNVRAIKRTQY